MKEVVNIMFKSYHFFLLFLYDIIIQMSSENHKTVQTPDMWIWHEIFLQSF